MADTWDADRRCRRLDRGSRGLGKQPQFFELTGEEWKPVDLGNRVQMSATTSSMCAAASWTRQALSTIAAEGR
jgi:hypothetical protein